MEAVIPVDADATPSAVVQGFSLFAGGLLYRIAFRLGVVRGESTLTRLGVALALLAWVPLLLLAGLAGLTIGRATVPFARSLGTHARFLLTIPFFFAAEAWAGPRIARFLAQIVQSRLVLPQDMPSLDRAVVDAMRRRDSVIVEVVLVVLAVVLVTAGVRIDLPGDVSSWRSLGGVLTAAGWWYTTVSLPLFQFLFLRWCWRLIIWAMLLWRVSRLNLQLVATHPDLAGGLGYLGVAQGHLGTLCLAVSTFVSASFAEQILFAGVQPTAFLPAVAGVIIINLFAFLGPLLIFVPRLMEVKRRGLREYGVVAAAYAHQFEAKWVRGRGATDEGWLGSPDIQSLADLANSFGLVRHMRLTPFGPALVLSLTASTVAPMAPLLLFQFSLPQLARELVKLVVLGV